MSQKDVARALVDRHGTTYAQQAGINLKDSPMPLYQLLVLSVLLSARISAEIAVAAASELFKAGYRTPQAMRDATWQQRVDALGRGHYRRYDERTSTTLGDGAQLVLDQWNGDLRRLHEKGDPKQVAQRLQRVPGIGPAGAAIFCREVQGVWQDLAPFVDDRVKRGAERVGLPTTSTKLSALVANDQLPHLIAACVRASFSKRIVDDVRQRHEQ